MGDLVKFKRETPSGQSSHPAKLDPVLVMALILGAIVLGAFLGRGVDLRPAADGVMSRLLDRSAGIAPQGIDAPAQGGDSNAASFYSCHTGGGTNCVVDGDTFWFRGEKYRIADIDAPETHPPRCTTEADLGERATVRLQALLNGGAFQLEAVDRDTDRYGRKLRIVTRNGQSLGDILVGEGLARKWAGYRKPWC